jgi:hypothetical protein
MNKNLQTEIGNDDLGKTKGAPTTIVLFIIVFKNHSLTQIVQLITLKKTAKSMLIILTKNIRRQFKHPRHLFS